MSTFFNFLKSNQTNYLITLGNLLNASSSYFYSYGSGSNSYNITGGFFHFYNLNMLRYLPSNFFASGNISADYSRFKLSFVSQNVNFNNSSGNYNNIVYWGFPNETDYSSSNISGTSSASTNQTEDINNQLVKNHINMLSILFENDKEYLMYPFRYRMMLFRKYNLNDYYNSVLSIPIVSVYRTRDRDTYTNNRFVKLVNGVWIQFYYNLFEDTQKQEKLYSRFEQGRENEYNVNAGYVYIDMDYIYENFLSDLSTGVVNMNDKNRIKEVIENTNQDKSLYDYFIMCPRNHSSHYILFQFSFSFQDIPDDTIKYYNENDSDYRNMVEKIMQKKIIYVQNESNLGTIQNMNNIVNITDLENFSISFKLNADILNSETNYRNITYRSNFNFYEIDMPNRTLKTLRPSEIRLLNEMMNDNFIVLSDDYHKMSVRNYTGLNLVQEIDSVYQYVLLNDKTIQHDYYINLNIFPVFVVCYKDAFIKAEGNIKYTSIKFVRYDDLPLPELPQNTNDSQSSQGGSDGSGNSIVSGGSGESLLNKDLNR